MSLRPARHPLLTGGGLMMISAAANGFGRFGYGLVLPTMQQELGWSATLAGAVASANAVGYLAGASVAGTVLLRQTRRRGWRASVVVACLTMTALSSLACAVLEDVWILAFLRLLAGASSAVAFVGGAIEASMADYDAKPAGSPGRVLGLYSTGPGLGIAVSAVTVGPLATQGRWRLGWLSLGIIGLACIAVARHALGRGGAVPTVGASQPNGCHSWNKGRVMPLLVSYGLFGMGYIAHMTFAVAYLRRAGATPAEVSVFWLVLGSAGIVIGATLTSWIGWFSSIQAVAATVTATALSSVVMVLTPDWYGAIGSAVLFGAFLSVTTLTARAAYAYLDRHDHAPAVAGLTVAFGVGQCVGPLVGGVVSDGPSGYAVGLLTGAGLLVASAAVALTQDLVGRRQSTCGGSLL